MPLVMSKELTILSETDTFKVVYSHKDDAIETAIEGKPNFFIIHKQTGRVEASVESVVMALDILNIATENLKKIMVKDGPSAEVVLQ